MKNTGRTISAFRLLIIIMAAMMPCGALALQGDVAYMAARMLGTGISVRLGGEPAEQDKVAEYMEASRQGRTDQQYWHFDFVCDGYYDAEVSCYKRNDGRCLVLHTISTLSADSKYTLHSASCYIFDGRKLYPVKELPCNMPICDADFANGLGMYYYMTGGGQADDWQKLQAPSNIEYRTLTERSLAVLVHDGTPGHRIVELAWNGDKFMKRPGKMQLINATDLGGVAIGQPLPKDGDLGDVRVVTINDNTFYIRQGSIDIARVDTKKDLVSCITIMSPDYCTEHKLSVGAPIDPGSKIFASRLGSDVFVDQQGRQYRVDANNICREIVIKQ